MTRTYAEIHPNMVVPALVHDGALYLESMDIIEYLDDAFGGTRLIPANEAQRSSTMDRVEQAKVLHRSLRFVTFHWGLGRLAMLNQTERQQLAALANDGQDEEQLVSFYDQYSTGQIQDATYFDHLRRLYSAFSELDDELEDGRQFLMSDELSIADAFWSMKILRLKECGYPVEEHHPSLHAWYERVSARPSFQNEVMGRNRLTNLAFRTKSKVEGMFGNGLKQAVEAVAV